MAAFSHKTFARNDHALNSLDRIDKLIIALDTLRQCCRLLFLSKPFDDRSLMKCLTLMSALVTRSGHRGPWRMWHKAEKGTPDQIRD
jgi:hypothetical protein